MSSILRMLTPVRGAALIAVFASLTGLLGAAPAASATTPPSSATPGSGAPDSPTPPTAVASVTASGHGAVSVRVGSSAAPELAVAYVATSAVVSGQMQTISGGGLTWSRATWINALGGDAEIWSALTNGSAFTASAFTASAVAPAPAAYTRLTVVTYAGAAGLGAVHVGAGTRPLQVSLSPTASGSLVAGVGVALTPTGRRSAVAGQSLTNSLTIPGVAEYFDQQSDTPTVAGTPVTLADIAAGSVPWIFAAVEIRSIEQCLTRSDTVVEYGVTLTLTIGSCTTPTQIISTSGSYSYSVGRNETVDYSQINHGPTYPGPGVSYGSSVTVSYFSEDLGFIVGKIAVLNAQIGPNGVITFNQFTGG